MTPIVFEGCAGWLHPAAGNRGVIVCAAQGYEELCTHRPIRGLAERFAEAGLPTLRFDYPGTGDSIGDERDPARVRAWLDSIHAAARYLRQTVGVEEIAIVGLRVGALLGTLAAEELGDVAALALMAPPVSGRVYVRELQAFSTMFTPPPDGSPPPADAEALQATGFLLSSSTVADLKALGLLKLQRRPATRVMLLHRPDAPPEKKLAARLRELGAVVEETTFDGFSELMDEVCYGQRLPHAIFARLTGWLADGSTTTGRTTAPQVDASLTSDGFREEPVRFGEADRLFGVLCKPGAPRAEGFVPTVLFLNTGHHHHIGFGRMAVTMARRLAAEGIASLRFDSAGLGDSDAMPGRPEGVIYSTEACADVGAAISMLEARGHRHPVVVGHCSGAHLAFHSTVLDTRIAAQVLMNLQVFIWGENDTLETVIRARRRSGREILADVWRAVRQPATWHRLMRGEKRDRELALALLNRAGRVAREQVAKVGGRLLGVQTPVSPVEGWFRAIDARGTQTLLLYSAGDEGLTERDQHLGEGGEVLAGLSSVHTRILESADHLLSQRALQERVATLLSAFVTGLTTPTRPTASPGRPQTVTATGHLAAE
ncbi:MAG: alpha/beta fold hydrolase [Reyranellaceae bacterium]